MFALAYYCFDAQLLFLGRDRTGEKPLYYSSEGKSFIFSSDLKAIVNSGLMDLKLCNEAISHYFAYGFIGAPLSIYSGIKKLCPGEIIKVQFSSGVVEVYILAPNFSQCPDFSHKDLSKISGVFISLYPASSCFLLI